MAILDFWAMFHYGQFIDKFPHLSTVNSHPMPISTPYFSPNAYIHTLFMDIVRSSIFKDLSTRNAPWWPSWISLGCFNRVGLSTNITIYALSILTQCLYPYPNSLILWETQYLKINESKTPAGGHFGFLRNVSIGSVYRQISSFIHYRFSSNAYIHTLFLIQCLYPYLIS